MCDHGERCSGEGDSPPIQPCTRIALDVRGHGEKYSRRETHSLPNHDAKIALDMCDHGGYSGGGDSQTNEHSTRIASEICDHGERCSGEGGSLAIQPWHQDCIRNV